MTARFDNHFKLLENQFTQMQIQIETLTNNMKDLRSAFNDEQGIPPTDEDQTWMSFVDDRWVSLVLNSESFFIYE